MSLILCSEIGDLNVLASRELLSSQLLWPTQLPPTNYEIFLIHWFLLYFYDLVSDTEHELLLVSKIMDKGSNFEEVSYSPFNWG